MMPAGLRQTSNQVTECIKERKEKQEAADALSGTQW